MTGKELLLSALRGEQTSRPAWVPFVGCHGGFLIDTPASTQLCSSELLVQGLRKAKELYKPDGLPVTFDLQIEAEILGCKLHWADDVPPSVVTHPLMTQTLADLPEFDESKGRIPVIIDALDTLVKDFGDDVAMYGLICGPFTLALHLMGNDIFLEMFDDEEGVKAVCDFAADIGIKMADIYLDHGASVIAVVDPMTSQISPEHFESFVAPFMNKIFDHIRARGGLSSIFVCGDVSRNLEVMCNTRADNISVDEQIPLDRLRSLCEPQGKSFGGNIKLTGVLLLGDEDDARMETISILDTAGNKGFVLAPGCDLPYHTPAKNLQAVAELVHDPYKLELARNSVQQKEQDDFSDIELTDYSAANGVVMDVITLDSTSCAPCQYMMDAVNRAAEKTEVKVFINEHKIKVREGIGMMVKLGVKNLPTICINGEVAFASIIPDQKTLVAAIESAASVETQ